MDHENAFQEWDLVIEPQSSLFDIHWKDLWRYRDLLVLLVRRDFVSFYKQTVLGPIWFFIQPVFTTLTYMFVFGRLAGLSTDGLPKPLFYMAGIISWNYFSECLVKTSSVFRDNANIFGKVYFPRLVMPISIIISSLIRFCVQLLLLIIVILYYVLFEGFSLHSGQYILLLPVSVIQMALLGLGLGMVISSITTKYRDVAFLVTFGVQLLMYATPVVYPLSSAPSKFRMLIALNPLSGIIETFKYSLFGSGQFNISLFWYSSLFTLVALFAGVVIYNRVEKNFIDTI